MKPTGDEFNVMVEKYCELMGSKFSSLDNLHELQKFLVMWEATRDWRAKVEQAESNDLLEAFWGGPKTVDDLEREGK
jgi:hypothetical protein